jgi:hypothetical protein
LIVSVGEILMRRFEEELICARAHSFDWHFIERFGHEDVQGSQGWLKVGICVLNFHILVAN